MVPEEALRIFFGLSRLVLFRIYKYISYIFPMHPLWSTRDYWLWSSRNWLVLHFECRLLACVLRLFAHCRPHLDDRSSFFMHMSIQQMLVSRCAHFPHRTVTPVCFGMNTAKGTLAQSLLGDAIARYLRFCSDGSHQSTRMVFIANIL